MKWNFFYKSFFEFSKETKNKNKKESSSDGKERLQGMELPLHIANNSSARNWSLYFLRGFSQVSTLGSHSRVYIYTPLSNLHDIYKNRIQQSLQSSRLRTKRQNFGVATYISSNIFVEKSNSLRCITFVLYILYSLKKRTPGKSILPYRVRYIGQCDGIKKGLKDIEGRVE